MKRRFTLCLIVLIPAFSAPVGASQILAGSFTTGQAGDKEPVQVTPALQLPLNAAPPFECSDMTKGSVALNNKARFCACDGHSWKLANSDEPCKWDSALR